jgi:hypothetical protein
MIPREAASRSRYKQEQFMIGNTFPGFRVPKQLDGQIRRVQSATLFIAMACMLILVEACLGSSDPVRASQVAAHIEGLAVVVQPSDGTYEIQTRNGGNSVIHARVAAEIEHKWLKSTDYPKHEISQSNFEDALGHGKRIKVTSSGLSNLPDLAYTLQIYDSVEPRRATEFSRTASARIGRRCRFTI